MHGRKGPYFKFTIGNVVYQFNKELWKTLFGITIANDDENEKPDPWITDIYTHVNFVFDTSMNNMLIAHIPQNFFEPVKVYHRTIKASFEDFVVACLPCFAS